MIKYSRYLVPSALFLALSGCYINAYPPEPTTPASNVTPVIQPLPQKVVPYHGKGFNPHPMPVPVPPTPIHGKGFNPVSKPITPAPQPVKKPKKPMEMGATNLK